MKIYNRYIAAFLLLFVVESCSEILEVDPQDQLITDDALSTLSGLEGSIWGIYERGRSPYESNDLSTYKIAGTDLVQAGSHLPDQQIVQSFNNYNFQLNAQNSGVADIWNAYYTAIHRANVILKNAETIPIDNDNPTEVSRKEKVMGIAYYFRAYFHLNLVQRWDNIVLKTDAPDVIQLEETLAEKVDVYAQIEEDLLAAINLLPETVEADGNGSVSKGVARHLLSKAYLDMEEWTKAALQANAVINDPAYALEDLDVIFSELEQDNREIIFAWQFTSADVNHPSRTVQQMIPLYDRVEGITRSFEYGGRPWARLYPSEYLIDLYEPTDKRLSSWYVTEYRYNDPENLPEGIQMGDVATLANIGTVDPRHITPTTTKYWETDALGRMLGDAQGYKNVIEFRLAEAYLIAAEAVMRGGQVEGKSATDFINVLRERAGVELYTSLDEQKLLDEHARELAHEGHRWSMLKRLGLLVPRVNEYNDPGAAGNIQPYHVRWPIPQSFVQLTGVQQNPGYVN